MSINLPIGTIIAWENLTIPSGWAICDGAGGTPNLVDKFVMGASIDGDVRGTGGATTHTHTNSATSTRATHNHGGSKTGSMGGGSTAQASVGSGESVATTSHTHGAIVAITGADGHSHTVGDTGSSSSLPRYIKRAFIRRMS
jgi:hypothetical protein